MPPVHDVDAARFPDWLNKASRFGTGDDAFAVPAPPSTLEVDWFLAPQPIDFTTTLWQANLHFHCREYDEALAEYEFLVRLTTFVTEPQRARAYYNIGIVKMHQNRPGEAIQAFQDAYACDPSLFAPLFARGCVLWSLDLFREALDTFNAAKRIFAGVQHVRRDDEPPRPPIVDPGLATAFHYTKLQYNISLVRSKLPDLPAEDETGLIYELHPMDRSKVFESEFDLEEMQNISVEEKKRTFRDRAKRMGRNIKQAWAAGVDRLNTHVH